ncbi:MAG: VOC family protein [Endozoicomonas sp.]|uniref:VOC family protein n=1 Tax=Endozoicomonas sp. TaxID=1892382 RepID=UPI003D9B2625
MIIDHIGFAVAHYEQSKDFYCKVLAPLGIELVMEVNGWAGLGAHQKPELWFGEGEAPQNPMHLALIAPNRAAVDKFYELAIASGAVDNGAPGIREIYHPDYYGAFVIDLNGHNLEAVCHAPES